MEAHSGCQRRKGGTCCKKEAYESLETLSQKYIMGTHCTGKHLVSVIVLASHLEWRGEPRGVLPDLEGGAQKHAGRQAEVPCIWH